jgi:hypothetical protein
VPCRSLTKTSQAIPMEMRGKTASARSAADPSQKTRDDVLTSAIRANKGTRVARELD